MLEHILLILVQRQLFQDKGIPLDGLGSGEAHRQTRLLGVILDEMHHRVDAAVDGAAVVVPVAEILLQRRLLILGDMDGVADQLIHALVLGGGDGDHRHAQHGLHGVDIDGALIAHQLVHHVQRHHHGDAHLQKLHGQVQVPLDVGGVHDIDDGLGLVLQNEVPGHDLLAAEGGHGVDARQVGDLRVGIPPDDAGFPVHRNAGEVAHVLLGAGELVEQGGLTAVLVAHQRVGQDGAIRQGMLPRLAVVLAAFTQTGVIRVTGAVYADMAAAALPDGLDLDLIGLRQAQGQLVAVYLHLHRVAHRGQLHHRHLRAGDHAHIQKMLAQCALAAHLTDHGAFADL